MNFVELQGCDPMTGGVDSQPTMVRRSSIVMVRDIPGMTMCRVWLLSGAYLVVKSSAADVMKEIAQ